MDLRIGIVDDNRRFHKMLHQDLSSYNDIEVCLTAYGGKECLDKLSILQEKKLPHILLMDIDMPEMNGIETVEKITEFYPFIRCIMFTVIDEDEKILRSIMAGAMGYLLKSEKSGYIYKAIHEVHKGGSLLSPSIARRTLELMKQNIDSSLNNPSSTKDSTSPELLKYVAEGMSYEEAEYEVSSVINGDTQGYYPSKCELKILQLLSTGLSSKEIASQLFNSIHTINTHRKNIMNKAKVRSTVELLNMAKNMKWIA